MALSQQAAHHYYKNTPKSVSLIAVSNRMEENYSTQFQEARDEVVDTAYKKKEEAKMPKEWSELVRISRCKLHYDEKEYVPEVLAEWLSSQERIALDLGRAQARAKIYAGKHHAQDGVQEPKPAAPDRSTIMPQVDTNGGGIQESTAAMPMTAPDLAGEHNAQDRVQQEPKSAAPDRRAVPLNADGGGTEESQATMPMTVPGLTRKSCTQDGVQEPILAGAPDRSAELRNANTRGGTKLQLAAMPPAAGPGPGVALESTALPPAAKTAEERQSRQRVPTTRFGSDAEYTKS
jgi:hypothetical protein